MGVCRQTKNMYLYKVKQRNTSATSKTFYLGMQKKRTSTYSKRGSSANREHGMFMFINLCLWVPRKAHRGTHHVNAESKVARATERGCTSLTIQNCFTCLAAK